MGHDELDTRLRLIENSVAAIETLLKTKVEQFESTLGDPGIVLRVDRIEAKERIRGWIAKTALGAAVTAFIGFIWSQLTGK
jgi:hypothetical protein